MKKRMFAVSALFMAAAIAGTSAASSATVVCAYAETADEDKVELPDRDIDDVAGTLESITVEYTGNDLSSDNPKPSKDDLIVKGQYTVTPSSGKSYTRTETITDYTIIRDSRPGVTAGGVMKTRDGRKGMITIWTITVRDKNTGKDISCNIQIPYVSQRTELVLVSDDTEDTDKEPEDDSGKTVSGLDGNNSKSTSSDDDEEIIDAEEDSPDSSKEDTSKDKKEESVIKKDKKKSRKAAKKPSKKKRTKKNSKRKNKAARKRLSTKKSR